MQVRRNRGLYSEADHELPVLGTVASQFANQSVDLLWARIVEDARTKVPSTGHVLHSEMSVADSDVAPSFNASIVPAERSMYLGNIAKAVRDYHGKSEAMGDALSLHAKLEAAADHLGG
jgi:methylmalonyl-CoA mutase